MHLVYTLLIFCCQIIIGHGFIAGTLVKTPDGYVPIEQINVDDCVISCNLDSRYCAQPVTAVWQTHANCYLHLTVDDEIIGMALDSRFYMQDKRWLHALFLSSRHTISCNNAYPKRITIRLIAQPVDLYILTVAEFHNFCITRHKIVVHNWNMPVLPDIGKSSAFLLSAGLTQEFVGSSSAHALSVNGTPISWNGGRSGAGSLIGVATSLACSAAFDYGLSWFKSRLKSQRADNAIRRKLHSGECNLGLAFDPKNLNLRYAAVPHDYANMWRHRSYYEPFIAPKNTVYIFEFVPASPHDAYIPRDLRNYLKAEFLSCTPESYSQISHPPLISNSCPITYNEPLPYYDDQSSTISFERLTDLFAGKSTIRINDVIAYMRKCQGSWKEQHPQQAQQEVAQAAPENAIYNYAARAPIKSEAEALARVKEIDDKGSEKPKKRIYEHNPKHQLVDCGRASRKPTNGQQALDCSFPIAGKLRRVGVDFSTWEIVAFYLHREDAEFLHYHGCVLNEDGLKRDVDSKGALYRAGMIDNRGTIYAQRFNR